MEGLCNQEGVQEDDNVYLFSLSGSVLVLSLVKIDKMAITRVARSYAIQLGNLCDLASGASS